MSAFGDWALAIGMTVVVTVFWLTSTPWWQRWTRGHDDDQS